MSSLFGIGAGSASTGFYPETIDQSLRFNDDDNAYLNDTSPQSGNRRTFTISFWFKRSTLGTYQALYSAGTTGNYFTTIYFYTNDVLYIQGYASSITHNLITTQVFRDTNWYHMVIAFDTTQATASNRIKLYINGSQVTSFDTETYPSQNHETFANSNITNNNISIGAYSNNLSASTFRFDGYLAEYNLIDGTALTPSSFGETKNGVWIPKAISGLTYGTNGFRLTFADSSNLGDDTSGNGNDFAVNGLASTDIVLDSPTNNFSTWNALFRGGEKSSSIYASSTLSEGNLKVSVPTNSYMGNTFRPTSGKWYMEMRVTTVGSSNLEIDWGWIQATEYSGNTAHAGQANKWGVFAFQTHIRLYDETSQLGSNISVTVSAGDILQLAWDIDNNKGWVGINNTWYRTDASDGNPSAGTNEAFTFTDDEAQNLQCYIANGTSTDVHVANFGQDDTFAGAISSSGNTDSSGAKFKYAPPTGFLALCSSNLPDTTISPNQSEQADDHFNTVIYSGNSSNTHQITGVGFQPDWLWIKVRNVSGFHHVADSSRGLGTGDSMRGLGINSTVAEFTALNDHVRSFDADGFTLDDNTDNTYYVNRNSDTYVAWNWRCGGSSPTKTYKVVVVSDSGNKYRFRNSADSATFAQSAVTLDLQEGGTYVFDWSDSTAQGHPIRFSTTSDGTHGGGSEYTTGVVKDDSAYKTTITVASSAPTLYYYCANHSGMGGQVNTNTTHGSTNFDGSILSVVQTNETAKFSILTYTGTGSNATIGHGLGVAPSMVITKVRNTSNNWGVYHVGINDNTKALLLDTNGAATAYGGSTAMWNNTAPTSTVFSVGTNASTGGSANYVAYVFAEVEGYSKFGSYTGNGSTDGTFVFTGFRPAWVMIKQTNSTGSWVMHDNKRSPFNVIDEDLFANLSSAESDNTVDKDFLSNGFKHRASHLAVNASGSTYIYMAFAEQPFQFSNAR